MTLVSSWTSFRSCARPAHAGACRRGSTEKGTAFVKRLMRVRILPSALSAPLHFPVQNAVLHDQPHFPQSTNVLARIALDGDEVGEQAHLHGTDLLLQVQHLGG